MQSFGRPEVQRVRVPVRTEFFVGKVLVESFAEEPSRLCAVVRKTRSLGTKQWKLTVWSRGRTTAEEESSATVTACGWLKSFLRPVFAEGAVETRRFLGKSFCRKF